MTDEYDVTTEAHRDWVRGLKVGDRVEVRVFGGWDDGGSEPVTVYDPSVLRYLHVRPIAAERERMAGALMTLQALQLAHDEWRDRALRAEALAQRLEAPDIRPAAGGPNVAGMLRMAEIGKTGRP